MTYLTRYNCQKNLLDTTKLFEDIFDFQPFFTTRQSSLPLIDISESLDDIIVSAELPGLNKKEVSISYEDNQLTISGKRENELKKENEKTLYQERRLGSFSRTIVVGEINFDQSKATFKEGLLTVVLPKPEKVKAKILEIS